MATLISLQIYGRVLSQICDEMSIMSKSATIFRRLQSCNKTS